MNSQKAQKMMGKRQRQRTDKPKNFKQATKRLISYLAAHKIALIVTIIFAIASVVFNIIGPKILGQVTTDLYEGLIAKVQGTGSINFHHIAQILLALLLLYCVSALCGFIQNWLMCGVTQKICYKLRKEIAEKISCIPVSYFDKHSKGDVLSRITNDVDTLSSSINQCVTQSITAVTQIVGIIIMMFSISPLLCGVACLVLPAAALALSLIVKASQRFFVAQQNTLGAVNGIVEEDFAGQNIIQIFNRQHKATKDFTSANDKLFESAWKAQFISGIMPPFMNLISNMGYVGVVVVGAKLAIQGSIHVGDVQSFIQYVKNFNQPVRQLGNIGNVLQSTAAAAERVFDFLDAEEELDGADAHVHHHTNKQKIAVAFKDISFGYEKEAPVIKDFSADILQGQTVAIVGPTGAGKSTLMKLLMRYYDIDKGTIYVDGQDIQQWKRKELRQQFSMVLQDSWLFSGTIRENIAYGSPQATDEEIMAAARAAQCDKIIQALDGGLDFVINEDASNVSQGERQLFTIARAILANRPMLILDEATSNVDTRTEELIQKAMNKLMAAKTSFVIAHRLSTIKAADTILVVKEGNIVEQGTHEELLDEQGFYAKLYNSQFENCL